MPVSHRLVDVLTPCTAIANHLAIYFSEVYAPNNRHRASSLYNEYISLRENYFGLPLAADLAFDTELVSKITLELKPGKAPDTNGLTAEHLLQAHPILQVILGKLLGKTSLVKGEFDQLILLCKQIPDGFVIWEVGQMLSFGCRRCSNVETKWCVGFPYVKIIRH